MREMRTRFSSLLASALALLGSLGASATLERPALAQVAAGTGKLSSYERETLRLTLEQLKLEMDPAPDGKTIESIETAALEVFDEREGSALQLLNVFHATTRSGVLRREVLLRPGQTYDRDLAEESARNLRVGQLSLVLVVAVKGTTANTVRLLVITKDVWSLRLSWDLKLGSGGLDLLRLEPTETNVAGTHQSISTRFILRPETYTLGASYRVPRLQGERLALSADVNVVMNKASGEPEGSYGSSFITRPLFSARTKWAWLVSTDWRNENVRRYVDTRVALYDARITAEKDALRDEYRALRFTETAAVTRSFGVENKIDVSLGAEMARRSYRLPGLTTARFAPEVLAEYQRVRMPVGDTRVGPAWKTRFYTAKFKRLLDFETLGLQEDVRLGYDFSTKIYPVFHALGSTRSFFGTDATAQYTWVVGGDGIFRVGSQLLNEFEEQRIADGAVAGDLRFATPSLGFGRLIFDGTVVKRYRNYLNRQSSLGGDGRLRGYPTSFFVGKDVIAGNVEYRTPTLQVFTVLMGAAAFYDAGHAFTGFDSLRMQHSAGAGLRILFPQLDRVVFRADGAFPITRPLPVGVSPFGFFLAFDQAFELSTFGSGVGPTTPATPGILNL